MNANSETHLPSLPILYEQPLSPEPDSEDAPFDRWIMLVDILLNQGRPRKNTPKVPS